MLNFEAIVRSCYANPDRDKYPCISFASVFKLDKNEKYDCAEKILKLASETIPLSVAAFDAKKIRLYSLKGFKEVARIGMDQWLERIRYSRWHGPFVCHIEGQIVIIFHSVTNNGYFDGVAIGIELGKKRMYYLRNVDAGIEIGRGIYFSESKHYISA